MDLNFLIDLGAFAGSGICIGLGAVGAAMGTGITAGEAVNSYARRPEKSKEIFRTMLIGQAVAQNAGIFALVVSIMLLFVDFNNSGNPLIVFSALLSAGICMGMSALISGYGASLPATEAVKSISRQPLVDSRLFTNMLIGQAICQTPSIFAMVVSLLLMFLKFDQSGVVLPYIGALLGAGIACGMGGMGSSYGGGMAGGACCQGIGRNPEASGPLFTSMLIGQAMSQTPAIFALLISFLLLFKGFGPEDNNLVVLMAMLGAGISMGIGGVGPGIGNGLAAEGAVEGVSKRSEETSNLTVTMLIGQAIAQTPAIFAMLVSFLLIFQSFGPEQNNIIIMMAMLGAGISMGFGGIGPGIGNGIAAKNAALGIAKSPEAGQAITRVMLIGQAVSQSTAIYALMVSLVLIFLV
jgi:F-type H+-transporting ATPase subunit c